MSERTTVLVRLHQIRTRVQQNKIKNQYGPISSGPELAAVGRQNQFETGEPTRGDVPDRSPAQRTRWIQ